MTGTSHAAVPHIRSQSDSKDIHAAAADLQPLSLVAGSCSSSSPFLAHHRRRSVFSFRLSVSPCRRLNVAVARVAPPRRGGSMRARGLSSRVSGPKTAAAGGSSLP